jgi:hypothetical protein
MLAERGIDVSYETIRRWILKFGPAIAAAARVTDVSHAGRLCENSPEIPNLWYNFCTRYGGCSWRNSSKV